MAKNVDVDLFFLLQYNTKFPVLVICNAKNHTNDFYCEIEITDVHLY